MLQKVGESIRVGAVFGPGSLIRPVWFDWRKKKHTVKEVTYRWRHAQGEALHLHFAVTDGGALYELVFNAGDQTWKLETLEAD